MSCPAGSIKNFPLTLSGTQNFSDIRNELTVENINLIFKWGSSFSYPNIQILNASSTEITHNSFNSTSLVYNYLNYKLINVQITTANFSRWLSLLGANSYDIVLTFIREPVNGDDLNKNPQIILLVNPIIISSTRDNDFLKGLAGLQPSGSISQKNISTERLFENNSANDYAYYTTCIDINNSFGNFQNMLVVVNTGGTLFTTTATIDRIQSIITSKITGGITKYTPVYFDLPISVNSTITSDTFKQKVKISNGYIIREDLYLEGSDAYKCVPLNPENDMDGAQIKNDSNATSLKSILDEREKEKNLYSDAFTKRIGLLSEIIKWMLVSVFGIIILFLVWYLIKVQIFGSEPLTFTREWWIFSRIGVSIIFSIIGIVLGFFIGFGRWKAPEEPKPSGTPSGTPSG